VAVFQDAVQQRGEAAGYAVMRREEGVGQAERGKERNYTRLEVLASMSRVLHGRMMRLWKIIRLRQAQTIRAAGLCMNQSH
jgi:hypothetical protein